MKTNGNLVVQVINFIYNKNLDIIPQIFSGKIEDHFVAHLINKARYFQDKHNNNTLGWVDFIMSLDQQNITILEEYILKRGI